MLASGEARDAEAIAFVRELIDRTVITPTPKGEPVHIDLVGNLATLFLEPCANQSPISVVAGAGFEPTTFRL